MMTLEEIGRHERVAMWTRRSFGYDQYDDHIWCWLNHHLRIWGEHHPIKVGKR